MTGRDPRFREGAAFVIILIVAVLFWIGVGLRWTYAAEKPREAAPTSEMVDYCQNPAAPLCAPSERVSVDLTWERKGQLERVHGITRSVLGPDLDCDGYVVQAIEALAAYGFPAGSMAWGSGWTRGGVHHAWLIVYTSEGEIMLDPLQKDITRAGGVVEYSHAKRCDWLKKCWRANGG